MFDGYNNNKHRIIKSIGNVQRHPVQDWVCIKLIFPFEEDIYVKIS